MMEGYSKRCNEGGQECIPDALVAYHLRRVGGPDNDPDCVRFIAAATAAFVRQLVAEQVADDTGAKSRGDDEAASAVTEEEGGYSVRGVFIATNAQSVVHIKDFRGESWVAKFDRPVRTPSGKRMRSIWYSCILHGHAQAEALARRHLPRVHVAVSDGRASSRKHGRGSDAVDADGGEGDGKCRPPPAKVFRAAPLLMALGAPWRVAVARGGPGGASVVPPASMS